jgi:hypothetical protein
MFRRKYIDYLSTSEKRLRNNKSVVFLNHLRRMGKDMQLPRMWSSAGKLGNIPLQIGMTSLMSSAVAHASAAVPQRCELGLTITVDLALH